MDISDKRAIYVFCHAVIAVEAKLITTASLGADGDMGSIERHLDHISSAACDIAYLRHLFADDPTVGSDLKAEIDQYMVFADGSECHDEGHRCYGDLRNQL